MRRVLILLLVVGILVGTIACEGFAECFQSFVDFSDGELTGDGTVIPLPCDGGGSGGSGGGTPG